MADKIHTLDKLPEVLGKHRGTAKVIHCHGVFDLMHIGHIRHFQEAKRIGGVLVVTITPDEFVNKGPNRPEFTATLRSEAVAALDCVDYVAINKWPDACHTIELLRPDYYVKGADYRDAEQDLTGGISRERQSVESGGGTLVFTDDITFSSSGLLNRNMPPFSKEVTAYAQQLKQKYGEQAIIDAVEKAAPVKSLMLGEAIIDEYQYCETIGKSGKEPILAAKYLSTEKFAGGVMAVANNAAIVCNEVGMLTIIGAVDSHEDFIREKMAKNVKSYFLHLPDSPTILKRRFLEIYPLQKMFEVYIMGEEEESAAMAAVLNRKLGAIIDQYDAVVATDYGHGMITPSTVELLAKKAKFLAINTQLNAANHGYNTVSKYGRADYICVSEKEIRLDARSRKQGLRDIVHDVARRLSCKHILITRGQSGCFCYDAEQGCFEIPAFTKQAVDRIGAGDLALAITAPCVAAGTPMEIVGFIANAVGAQAVGTIGHRTTIDKVSLLKFIKTMLK